MENTVKAHMSKFLCFLLSIVMVLGLVGCSGTDDEDYMSKIYTLSEEEELLVTYPSAEYVITALNQIESVIGIEASTDPVEGAVATIYFSSNLVDQSEFESEKSVEEKGTAAGGSIDVYKTEEEAIERDVYLHNFDGATVFESGGHAVAGSLVIRTSKHLDKEGQEAFTDEIVAALTSGEITDELIVQVMSNYNQQVAIVDIESESEDIETESKKSEVEDNRIKMTFSHEDVCYKYYTDVFSMFENLGFANIDYEVSEMNYTVKEEFDGAVLAVHIDEEWKFEEGALFDPEASVVISYVEDLRIQVPKASVDCEGKKYTDIVSLFEKAGFANVEAKGREIDYTTNVDDKTVVLISIDDEPIFDEDAKFSKDAEVRIYYYIILPAPFEAESTNDNNSSNTSSSQSNIDASQNDSGGTSDTGDNISGSQTLVWIPQSGSKYHSRSGCSNMKNPSQVTKEEAEQMGYEPCKRCH